MQAEKHRENPGAPLDEPGAHPIVTRHHPHRQGFTVTYWVLIQGEAMVEDLTATCRDLHMRQPFEPVLVNAAGSERFFLQHVLNPVYTLVWLEIERAMSCASDLGEVQCQLAAQFNQGSLQAALRHCRQHQALSQIVEVHC